MCLNKYSTLNRYIIGENPKPPLGNTTNSQPITKKWPHLSAVWGIWSILNVENHVLGSIYYMFGQVFQSKYMHTSETLNCPLGNSTNSPPVTGEWPRLVAVCGQWGKLNIENQVIGPKRVMFGKMMILNKCNIGRLPTGYRGTPQIPTTQWEMNRLAAVWEQ